MLLSALLSLLLSTGTVLSSPVGDLNSLLTAPHTIQKRNSQCDCPALGNDCSIWAYWLNYPDGTTSTHIPVCTSKQNSSNRYVCQGTMDAPNCNVCIQSLGYDQTMSNRDPNGEQCSGTPVCYGRGDPFPSLNMYPTGSGTDIPGFLARYDPPTEQPVSGATVSKCPSS